jgi:hypothetical protein
MEVTLNHNLDQFLRLAPDSFRNALFAMAFGRAFDNRFHMHGREVDEAFKLVYAMQPDFLFVSDSEVVSVEMKIGAKSSVKQVLKYALLGLAVELKQERPLSHHLLFLSQGDFSALWPEKFKTVDAVREAVDAADLAAFLKQQPVRFRSYIDEFTRIVRELKMNRQTYAQFADFLHAAAPPASDNSLGAEVYRKLLAGVLNELRLRQLTSAA